MIVRNRDNDHLGPPGLCGYVDEVNGEGATEMQFDATRHELFQIAGYWAYRAIDIEFFWFLYESPSSDEIRVTSAALCVERSRRRLEEI